VIGGPLNTAPKVEAVHTVTASGTAQTLPDPSSAAITYMTLTDACALTFPPTTAGTSFTLALLQDATGARLVTWPATVRWDGGAPVTLSAAGGTLDILTFACLDGATWSGFVAGLDVR
jgi:hypothetical protein